MKILVTGGSGMVGMNIQYTQHCIDMMKDDEYVFISSQDCDLTNKARVDQFFEAGKFDRVIHLAARVGGLYKNMSANPEMLIHNMRMNMNVLEACHKYNINRAIFCLSSCVYPAEPSGFPMTENMIDASPPHSSNEGYAYSKRMIKVLCDHYNKDFGREYICLSPVNLYGPYDNYNLKNSHVIPGLIHRMSNFSEHKKRKPESSYTFDVYGSGKALRQFLYAPDFARIILQFLNNEKVKSGLYNICDSDEYKISEIIQMLQEYYRIPDKDIYYNTKYSDGIIKKTVSNEKYRSLYPNFQFTDLKEGLRTATHWFHKNNKTCRK